MPAESTNAPDSSESEKSPTVLLGSLINVMLHRNGLSEKWLAAISAPIADKLSAVGKIGEMIRLSAKAGLEETLTQRIITAVVDRDELGWSAQKIKEFVDGIYPDVRKRELNDERRRQGLSSLK